MQVDHRKGPRRRGEVLEEAIMRAALAELAEVGYPGVSMEIIRRGLPVPDSSIVEIVDEIFLPLVKP